MVRPSEFLVRKKNTVLQIHVIINNIIITFQDSQLDTHTDMKPVVMHNIVGKKLCIWIFQSDVKREESFKTLSFCPSLFFFFLNCSELSPSPWNFSLFMWYKLSSCIWFTILDFFPRFTLFGYALIISPTYSSLRIEYDFVSNSMCRVTFRIISIS